MLPSDSNGTALVCSQSFAAWNCWLKAGILTALGIDRLRSRSGSHPGEQTNPMPRPVACCGPGSAPFADDVHGILLRAALILCRAPSRASSRMILPFGNAGFMPVERSHQGIALGGQSLVQDLHVGFERSFPARSHSVRTIWVIVKKFPPASIG